ncbi:MAG: hypothetical protein ACRC28_08970 [Clostridium sp.]|uniref:hypothetical protein n=1 Tax=Clostridium sp. TaxID=1506 RepID=UPI003F39DC17
MAKINTVFNKNGRYEMGFFGTPLGTKNINVIAPYTNVGGTVISTNPNSYGSVFNTWNQNTGGWANWNPMESIIPKSSTVEAAFLIWSSAYYPSVVPPFEIAANTVPINLIKPDGSTIKVMPDADKNLDFDVGWHQFTHGADITGIMKDNQYGDYKITAVPTGRYGGSMGLGGWGLYILYTHPSFPYRNANLNVSATGFNETVTVSGLITPTVGPVNVKIYLSSVQGDRGVSDSLLLNGTKLFGPFNPVGDFMNDRYVDYTGLALQTIGSLLPQESGEYGYYADQTVILNSDILKNGDTEVVLTQDNKSDWAGVSFVGILTDVVIPVKKAVDKNYASPGDRIVYTITFTNNIGVPIKDMIVTDTLPVGLAFVNNSVKINNSPNSGDITKGVTISNINPNEGFTLTFEASVGADVLNNTLFLNEANIDYNYDSNGTLVNEKNKTNVVSTTIVRMKIESEKFVDKGITKLNEILTYTIVVRNLGEYDIKDLVFKDIIAQNIDIIGNEITQDGIKFTYNKNDMILPNTILKNANSTISYKALVKNTIIENPILNSAEFKAVVTIPSGDFSMNVNSVTNIVVTTIAYIDLKISKAVDKNYASIGDIITYTLVLKNIGNVIGENTIFKDSIPIRTEFIGNSFTIDGQTKFGMSPSAGINIGEVFPNINRTITFKVRVI